VTGDGARRQVQLPPRAALGLLGVAALLASWEAISRWRLVDPALLPSFSQVARALVQGWTSPTIRASAYAAAMEATVGRVVLAFAICAAGGIASGVMIGLSRRLSGAVGLTLTLSRYLPPAMLAPIVLLLSGKGTESVLAIIIFGAFWPVLLNTIDGVAGVDHTLRDVARIYKLGVIRTIISVILPGALPQIIVGLRLAVSVCLLSAVVGEMLAGRDGLGYALLIAQRMFAYTDVYVCIAMLGVLGISLNGLFRVLERRLLAWHPVGRTEKD
jgi:ABC-type nitrate/sulfonate/bicarbonate transport system permease component